MINSHHRRILGSLEEQLPKYIIAVYAVLISALIVSLAFLIYKKCSQRLVQNQPTINSKSPNFQKVSPDIKMGHLKKYVMDQIVPKNQSEIGLHQKYYSSYDNCVICLEDFTSQQISESIDLSLVKLTLCSHLFHKHCLLDWMSRQLKCPTCRQNYEKQSIVKLGEQMGIDFDNLYLQEVQNKVPKKKGKKKEKEKRPSPRMINYRPEITRAQLQMDQQNDEQFLSLSPEQHYALKLYRNVIEHHKKQQEALQKSRITRASLSVSKGRESSSRRFTIISFDEQQSQNGQNDAIPPTSFRIQYSEAEPEDQ